MQMSEEKKTTKKAATPKAEAKAPAKKAAAPKATSKAAAKVSAPKSGKTVTVKQVGSPARSEAWAYQTLKGLGLGKLHRVRTLEDSAAVRGMITRVHHLVKVQDAA